MEICPQTLFTGRPAIWLPVCGSTNTELQLLVLQNRASEGCAVITGHQSAGRGQRGNVWQAAPHENLLLSVLWKPTFLGATRQFLLSQAVALAVHDWAVALLGPDPRLRLKWPNDVYFGEQKLGGILIENSLAGANLQHSIVGIGLNVNQQYLPLPTATSLAVLTGRAYDLATLAARLFESLERRYLQLRAGQVARLRTDYLAVLYRYQEPATFIVDGQVVSGQIAGVDEDGRLAVQLGQELRRFGMQEIKFGPAATAGGATLSC